MTTELLPKNNFSQQAPTIPSLTWVFGMSTLIPFLFGWAGLTDVTLPLISHPAFSGVLLMGFGTLLMITLILGVLQTAKNGEMLGAEWGSIRLPIQATMLAVVLLPVIENKSVLSLVMIEALKFGAMFRF